MCAAWGEGESLLPLFSRAALRCRRVGKRGKLGRPSGTAGVGMRPAGAAAWGFVAGGAEEVRRGEGGVEERRWTWGQPSPGWGGRALPPGER